MEITKKIDGLTEAFADALYPPDPLTVDEWANKHRMLPQSSAHESGAWRTSRFPFLKEIMDELSPESGTRMIVVQKGAQLGFTEIAINWMFYTIEHNPCPMLYVQKTIENVEKFSKQRLAPSVDECPRIRERLGGASKSRDSSNTIRVKSFPGGILMMGGANSAASLRSMPICNLALDEEDSYESDIDDEGSPSEIAIRRTANFPRKKIFRFSTPTIAETSRIEPLYQASDQRRYFVPCPFCNAMQVIYWKHIRYEDNDPKSAHMVCEKCKKRVEERWKTPMFDAGKWRAARPGRELAGFFISSLYSPLGFYSWREAVTEWLEIQREMDKFRLKVFINTVLAETFSETKRSVEFTGLLKRKEHYSEEVPEGVLVLVAGADVQDDRIECEVVGFGAGQESWSIDYKVLIGDTERAFVWEQLDQYLERIWHHQRGMDMNLACSAIDSGHRAKVVYSFCKPREFRRIFPVKGKDGWGLGYIRRPRKRNDDGVLMYNVFVDEIKSKIYSHLLIDTPREHKEEDPIPGFCHFPDKPIYDKDYFRMLTAEELKTKRVMGRKQLKWELPQGRRNEALDCRTYAIAALNILNLDFAWLEKNGPLVVRNKKLAKKRRARVHSRGI